MTNKVEVDKIYVDNTGYFIPIREITLPDGKIARQYIGMSNNETRYVKGFGSCYFDSYVKTRKLF